MYSIDNINNELNITGKMSDKTFNYKDLNLTITLLTNSLDEKISNVYFSGEKITEENYTLQCISKDELYGKLDFSVSDLGKEILIVNFSNGLNNTINFIFNKLYFNKIRFKKQDMELNTRVIIAIIVSILIILAIIAIVYLFIRKQILFKK